MWCSCHLPDGDPRVSYFSGQATVAVAPPAVELPNRRLVPSSAACLPLAWFPPPQRRDRGSHCSHTSLALQNTGGKEIQNLPNSKGGRGKERKGCGYLLPLAHASPPRCRLRNYRLYCCRLGHPTASRPPSLPARRRGAAGSLPLLRPWSPPCASAVAAGPRSLRPLPAAAAAGSSLPPIPRRR